MQFTRLRLSGFKSFVDPTELLIEPGLTGVVGPNGCGKSNLLEAIRWVMGENRAKSLRGSGMDDVIFAGTDRRSPRNLAEVTLVLENRDRNGPAGFNDEDLIEVTRRIERDSGSAYRINGKDVRQKDVQLLFADAATGAHSPALVSQGRIGNLINAKPQDRRAILEEAAGISGLHTRRKEAELRLRAAEGNLVRVQDVIQAMESQIAGLKRQAKQAVRYREISADIRRAEGSLLFLRWKMAADEVLELERAFRAAEAEVADVSAALAAASERSAEKAATLPALREADAVTAAALQRVLIERDNLAAELQRRRETAATLRATLEQIAADRAREEVNGGDATEALTRLKGERERLEAARDAEKDGEVAAREALDAAARAASAAEADYDKESERTAETRARKSSFESDRIAVNRRREQLEAESARIEREKESLAADDETAASVTAAEKAITVAEEALASLSLKLTELEAATQEARTARGEADSARAELAGALKALTAEVSGLRSLLAEPAAGAGRPVSFDLKAEPGFEAALGAALGEEAEAGLDAAAARHWLAAPAFAGINWPQGIVPLTSFVSGPDVLSRRLSLVGLVANDALLGDLAALVALLKPGQMVVTKDGLLIRADGFVVKAGAPTRAAQRLAHANRLAELEKELAAREAAMAEAVAAAEAAIATHEAARNAERIARDARQAAERTLADARRAHMAAMEAAARRENRLTALTDTAERLKREAADVAAQLEEIDARLAGLPDIAGLEGELASRRSQVEALRAGLAAARATYDGLRREAAARAERLLSIASEMKAWESRAEGAIRQIAELDERTESTKAQLAAVEAAPEEMAAREQALMDAKAKAEAARHESAEALLAAERALADEDRALRNVQERHAAAREGMIRAEAAVEVAGTKRKDIALQIGERFECDPASVLEKVGAPTSDSLPDAMVIEHQFESLKRERDRLGAVNLRADEELTEIEVQMTHLSGERDDLEAAIARLRGAIGSLNREGRERLLAAFEVVNRHFGELFVTLFGGGAAHLELTESDDPLEAGLEIFASPPGKRLQALSLLSGGEQALTALSLIFAVFITNPAPICVLDEVDAPLDDANVERFCNLLDEMTARTDTRFLIVTHNAVSMARMNRLFGVTMAERGISTLVSVDLERASELREAG
ncbi:chromosome segregation SMC family protein [Gimibacter soli]|uniref:Chromosome partition protein Smc n=1 Tax=Gimibacter soli TaxID=3024400 RepID=A0AAE9XQU6_9PROT|nr:AAA family ATPase [Gimibacter soli]WCL55512.1 AAA family ATPase [Gimibacter soli]